jgi:hypothetical protein
LTQEGKRDHPAHRLAEKDDRQAGMFPGDKVVDGSDIGDNFLHAVPAGEHSRQRILRLRAAVAAMILRIDMETASGEEIGESGVAPCVFREAVVDLDNSARLLAGVLHKEIQRGAARCLKNALLVEGHVDGGSVLRNYTCIGSPQVAILKPIGRRGRQGSG